MATLLVLFLPETKDLSLEEMDVLFGLVDQATREQDIRKKIDADQGQQAQVVTVVSEKTVGQDT